MKIGVIGGSASGLYTALFMVTHHPDFQVEVFDHCDKPGRKLLATGNGHCNLFNDDFSGSYFNHPDFVNGLLKRYPRKRLLDELGRLGISTVNKDGLYYPLSYSAASLLRYLVSEAEAKGVRFRLNEEVIGVSGTKVKTTRSAIEYDFLVYAFGGMSQSNLGSDGSCFEILKSAGYEITPIRPSLCPLKSLDVSKSLAGVRHKGLIKLLDGEKTIYEEKGEILFKSDGLSGIAIMNCSSFDCLRPVAEIDLFPDLSEEELGFQIEGAYRSNPNEFLLAILEKPLTEYMRKRTQILNKNVLNSNDFLSISHLLKALRFEISGRYGFDASQVTRGGVSLNDVDSNLRSRLEENVAFVGECLDIDGRCGGFNLGWALLSSLAVVDSI